MDRLQLAWRKCNSISCVNNMKFSGYTHMQQCGANTKINTDTRDQVTKHDREVQGVTHRTLLEQCGGTVKHRVDDVYRHKDVI